MWLVPEPPEAGLELGAGGNAVMPASLGSVFHESQCSSHEKKAGSVIMIIVYSSFYTFALSGIFLRIQLKLQTSLLH